MTSFALEIPRSQRAVTTPAAPGTGLANETAGKRLYSKRARAFPH
jgi:hypothetical protein